MLLPHYWAQYCALVRLCTRHPNGLHSSKVLKAFSLKVSIINCEISLKVIQPKNNVKRKEKNELLMSFIVLFFFRIKKSKIEHYLQKCQSTSGKMDKIRQIFRGENCATIHDVAKIYCEHFRSFHNPRSEW